MACATLEDQNAQVELVVFPRAFAEYGGLLEQEETVLVVGEKEEDSEKTKLLVTSLHTLAEGMDQQVESVRILLTADSVGQNKMAEIREVLRNSPGPCPVTITLHFSSRGEVDIKLPDTLAIRPTRSLQEATAGLFGNNALYLRKKKLGATRRSNGFRDDGGKKNGVKTS